MSSETLVVRADASVAMGTGHVMRCLALGQAWQDAGGDVVLAMVESSPAVEERLRSERIEIVKIRRPHDAAQDVSQLVELACTRQAEWVVVDGYQFDTEYQQRVKATGLKLLFVDDNGNAAHYFADLLLNQNAYAREDLYRQRDPSTKLLLGPRYALLRREFRRWRGWRREITPVARKVLVTMGGSDPDNFTARVFDALPRLGLEGLEARVVVGGSNPHMGSLELAAAAAGVNISLLKNPASLSELMAWADVAVSAAGSTCWEMCLLGLPSLLIDLAPNQLPVAQELARRKAAIHLGGNDSVLSEEIVAKLQWLLSSRETRTSMSERSRELVDGEGADRVVAAMRHGTLRLRRVEEKDCRLLWEWANDPAVRTVSFASEAISWEQHLKWFRDRLTDTSALLYLAINLEDMPVAQVRYSLEGTRAVVSISLAAEFRRQGNGNRVLAMAADELFRQTNATTIDAYVKPDNDASLRLFTGAGYRREASKIIRGQQAIHFVMEKNRVS